MIYTFKEIKKTLGSVYQVNLALDQGKYYKIEPGIYSNKKHSNYLEIIVKKYPKAIISGDSAYYYHNLTDTVPKYINVTTPRNSTRINNAEVRQSFTVDCYYCLGKTTIDYNGVEINIYDKERMLIELVKNKNNMS